VFIAMVLYGVHKRAGISTLLGTAGSAEGDGGTRIETLKTANQELKTQVRNLEEELRLASQDRDGLKEDKKQLLYMVEKLQQQSVTSAASGQGGGVSGKVVRSWLVRISELKNNGVREEAQARNEYIKEVNEVVRGLKEDFSEDTFIMGIGYAKTSSRVKNDINAAQTKLEDIIQYLRAYDPGVN
jgi:archaellum component FlaC